MAILTISREYGSGGSDIGKAVADRLGYEYLDKEKILDQVKSLGHRWEEWGKGLDERCPSIWEKYDWSFRAYGALVQSIILDAAVKDNVVVIGRGANFLLKDVPFALRVRIMAPMEEKVARIMKRESVSPEMARILAEKTDRERSCFLYSLYGRQGDELGEYDVTFNTGSKSLDVVITTIMALLDERSQQKTEAARRLLQKRAVAASVKAGLIVDFGFFLPTLDVVFDGDEMVVRGIVHNPREHKKVEDAARALAKHEPLKCELHYRG